MTTIIIDSTVDLYYDHDEQLKKIRLKEPFYFKIPSGLEVQIGQNKFIIIEELHMEPDVNTLLSNVCEKGIIQEIPSDTSIIPECYGFSTRLESPLKVYLPLDTKVKLPVGTKLKQKEIYAFFNLETEVDGIIFSSVIPSILVDRLNVKIDIEGNTVNNEYLMNIPLYEKHEDLLIDFEEKTSPNNKSRNKSRNESQDKSRDKSRKKVRGTHKNKKTLDNVKPDKNIKISVSSNKFTTNKPKSNKNSSDSDGSTKTTKSTRSTKSTKPSKSQKSTRNSDVKLIELSDSNQYSEDIPLVRKKKNKNPKESINHKKNDSKQNIFVEKFNNKRNKNNSTSCRKSNRTTTRDVTDSDSEQKVENKNRSWLSESISSESDKSDSEQSDLTEDEIEENVSEEDETEEDETACYIDNKDYRKLLSKLSQYLEPKYDIVKIANYIWVNWDLKKINKMGVKDVLSLFLEGNNNRLNESDFYLKNYKLFDSDDTDDTDDTNNSYSSEVDDSDDSD
ncbi:hypothetical protein [Acanthamoeba polyphaga mimivirus]|nr:hypothetical protein [Acanthamoeba castellanii mamavirus]EJN41225.1 hypothetical protein lvs_L114 [Acanthamoeba polyphaga lentillevirus]UMZ08335.1 hypothetical protein [Acanthamoeba polyphaga mimivirus]